MESYRKRLASGGRGTRKLDKHASYFLDLLICTQDVLVAQQIAESQFLRLRLRLTACEKWAIFRPQLFGGVARHPKGFFKGHCRFRPGLRTRLVAALSRCCRITSSCAIKVPWPSPPKAL